jgi:allantoicase
MAQRNALKNHEAGRIPISVEAESHMPEDTDFSSIWVDLAQPRLGSEVVFATDDFFAPKERLIDPADPIFVLEKFDENGKWMDGWESRRRRDANHDFCVVRLGRPGIIKGVEIDTRHFTGNYPPAASLEWAASNLRMPPDQAWKPLLDACSLKGDSRLAQHVRMREVVTHVRFHIYPDGGVARLRLYGQVICPIGSHQRFDLAAMENGALPVAANDEHYGRVANLLAPGEPKDMGDGWETRRRREPGNDWAIIALAQPGRIEEIELDTTHFKGNYPDRCSVQAMTNIKLPRTSLVTQSMYWPLLLPQQRMSANAKHRFSTELLPHEAVRFLRLNLIPDGGIARLRAWGTVAATDSTSNTEVGS